MPDPCGGVDGCSVSPRFQKTWPLQGQLYDGLTMPRSRIYDTAPPPVLSGLGVVCGFRPEFLEFRRGIHVGNLEEHERITRILKLALEARYGQPFVTERWGRGVYWHWIGFLPRANRLAKPISSDVSFGCSKFFLMVDTDERAVKFGLQIERGYEKAPRDSDRKSVV